MGNLLACVRNQQKTDEANKPFPIATSEISSLRSTLYTKSQDTMVHVVAIDLGSAFTGYAFSFDKDPDNIVINSEWFSENGTSSFKTPTCILIHNDEARVVDFGYEALSKYTRYSDFARSCSLYYHFTNALYDKKIQPNFHSVEGNDLELEVILTQTFEFLYINLENQLGTNLKNQHIKWVFPVMKSLSKEAQEILTKAAKKAKLAENDSDIHFPLESHAASLFCQTMDLMRFTKDQHLRGSLPVDTTYLVVNCGSRHISISAHEKTDSLSNDNVRGVEQLNEEFHFESTLENKLTCAFSKRTIESYKHKYPKDWIQMMIQFESAIRSYKHLDNSAISITCFATFANIVKDKLHSINPEYGDGVRLEGGILQIECDEIFDSINKKIIPFLATAFENKAMARADFIFVVGGLSPIIAPAIVKRFPHKKVIEPVKSNACVVKGAVLFGQSSSRDPNPKDNISRN